MNKAMDITSEQKLEFYGHNMLILYLTIASGFIVPLVSCDFQNAIKNSLVLKHLFGFMTLFFFAVLSTDNTANPTNHFIMAGIIYLWFVMTTKTTVGVTYSIVAMLFISYVLNSYRTYYATMLDQSSPDPALVRKIEIMGTIQKAVHYLIVFATIVGFVHFLMKQSKIGWHDLVKTYSNC